jgi:hypothetical protein
MVPCLREVLRWRWRIVGVGVLDIDGTPRSVNGHGRDQGRWGLVLKSICVGGSRRGALSSIVRWIRVRRWRSRLVVHIDSRCIVWVGWKESLYFMSSDMTWQCSLAGKRFQTVVVWAYIWSLASMRSTMSSKWRGLMWNRSDIKQRETCSKKEKGDLRR